MEKIVVISGDVNYNITLDLGSWLFDNRKVNLATYFDTPAETAEEKNYSEETSKNWDKTLAEGATPPSRNDNKISKLDILSDADYGICLGHFLKNAVPKENATKVILETANHDQYTISLEDAYEGILGFSSKGVSLKDGPLHFYYKDGRNKNTPYTGINKIVVR